MKYLIIDDDKDIARLLEKSFLDWGGDVHISYDGAKAISEISKTHFDVIILDLQLPGGMDGFGFVQSLRELKIDTPVLILSGLQGVEDKIRGLQLGGDDYLTKPFAMAELQVRIKNLLKRSSKSNESTIFSVSDLTLNRLNREVSRSGVNIRLHDNEYLLLELLITHQNKIISKNQILKQVWNYDFDPKTNVVDVLVCRLRNKIEKNFSKRLIYTVRGVGYIIKSLS